MNVAELNEAVFATVGEKSKLNKRQVADTTTAVFEAIGAALKQGEKVAVSGFGIFEVRDTAAKKGKNPSTGAEIDIPAGRKAAFKVSKALKDAIKA